MILNGIFIYSNKEYEIESYNGYNIMLFLCIIVLFN